MVIGKRDSCPTCGSIRIKNKIDDGKNEQYYKCDKCGWTGNNTIKVEIFLGSYSRGGGSIPTGGNRTSGIRDRPYCPVCNSVRLRRRVNTHDYYCENCRWIGTSPKKMKWGVENSC